MENIKYISLGGWCGTSFGLRGNGLRDCSLPFDWVRSKFEGVIDCIDTNFSNFIPNPLIREENKDGSLFAYRGKNFSFYHDDFSNERHWKKFGRRIRRFKKILNNSKQVVFMRTIITNDYELETKQTNNFHEVVNKKYPNLKYILIYVIPNQNATSYYTNLDNKTFIFTIDDRFGGNNAMKVHYKPIFDFTRKNNLFETIPEPTEIDIVRESTLLEFGNRPIFIE